MKHSGSAGKMEIDAILEVFQASVKKHSVKYVQYIGDGDSKTFKGIMDSKPYGDEILVRKKEFVRHLEKRMGTRLRKLKKESKGIGGKGKLMDKPIGELTKFYGLAIRRNSNSVENMRNATLLVIEQKSPTLKVSPRRGHLEQVASGRSKRNFRDLRT